MGCAPLAGFVIRQTAVICIKENLHTQTHCNVWLWDPRRHNISLRVNRRMRRAHCCLHSHLCCLLETTGRTKEPQSHKKMTLNIVGCPAVSVGYPSVTIGDKRRTPALSLRHVQMHRGGRRHMKLDRKHLSGVRVPTDLQVQAQTEATALHESNETDSH